MSNLRDIFHRRATESQEPLPKHQDATGASSHLHGTRNSLSIKRSPTKGRTAKTKLPSPTAVQRISTPVNNRSPGKFGDARQVPAAVAPNATPITTISQKIINNTIDGTSSLTFHIDTLVTASRTIQDQQKRLELVALAQILADVMKHANDAEKAVLKANQAALEAEVSYQLVGAKVEQLETMLREGGLDGVLR